MKRREKTRGRPFEVGNRVAVGNRGGGRPPDEFKRIMAELSSREETLEYFKKVLDRDPESDEFLVLATGVQVPIKVDADTWLKFWREASAYGFGKATQPVEHSGELQSRIVIVRPGGK